MAFPPNDELDFADVRLPRTIKINGGNDYLRKLSPEGVVSTFAK